MDDTQPILELLRKEIVLATGCTEPVAAALAVAKCRETLGTLPTKVDIYLSKNVFKNAMGVGIPGTQMIGLPIVAAIGATVADASRGLQILDISQQQIATAKQWLTKNKANIAINVKPTNEKLYIECVCTHGTSTSRTIIAQTHTNIVLVEKDGKAIFEKPLNKPSQQADSQEVTHLDIATIQDFVDKVAFSDIGFILETVVQNRKAAAEGAKGYGLSTGKILLEAQHADIQHVIAQTVAAIDARMDGCPIPIYSNSGSGNQGIICSLPVYEYAVLAGVSDETTVRALVLSHLISIYIKRGIGRLSALCGVVNASIGVAAGFVYLHSGSHEQVCYAIKNMVDTVAGMLCDGAKPSCSLKAATGIYAAYLCALLAINNKVVDETDGLAEQDVDNTIANIAKLGACGMNQVDDIVLDIMTNKKHN